MLSTVSLNVQYMLAFDLIEFQCFCCSIVFPYSCYVAVGLNLLPGFDFLNRIMTIEQEYSTVALLSKNAIQNLHSQTSMPEIASFIF